MTVTTPTWGTVNPKHGQPVYKIWSP